MKVFYSCKIAANRVFALPRQKETTLRAIFEVDSSYSYKFSYC